MRLTTRIEQLKLRHTFRISRGAEDTVPVVLVELEHDGVVGIGETSPNKFYGDDAPTVERRIRELAPWLERQDPFERECLLEEAHQRLGRSRAALTAIDLALHDWLGRKLGLPLHRILGLTASRIPPTSYTIGIDTIETMVAKLREAAHYRVIKVKLGTPQDLEILRALRKETRAIFRVDANCAWTVPETIEKSRELKALGVELIEQPLPPDRLEDMSEVFAHSALPVVADESSLVPEDIPRLAGKFHGCNIKLVKCGGLAPALRMIHVARALGLKIMIGCMIESSLGCTAAAQLGPLVDYLDVDGPLLISNDPYRGVEYSSGDLRLPLSPGLGVTRRS